MLRTSVFSLALVSLFTAGSADDFESRVTEFKLANGLPVLVYTDSSAPIVAVAVAYKVGSNYEPTGRTGLSHSSDKRGQRPISADLPKVRTAPDKTAKPPTADS